MTTNAESAKPTLLARIRDRLLPRMPDFYGHLVEQCRVTERGCRQLVEFLETMERARGEAVRSTERDGDALESRNLALLHRSFATPMDREDIYQAVRAIDDILNYARATVREVELFELDSDHFMIEMARGVHDGTVALVRSCGALKDQPEAADEYARAAIRSERRVEVVYRDALADLFDPRRLAAAPEPNEVLEHGAQLRALPPEVVMERISEVFRRREVYRHLSNAADRVVRAGEVLGDVIAKAT